MLLIIALVVAALTHVIVTIVTKPMLARDMRYLEERNDARYRAAKARTSA